MVEIEDFSVPVSDGDVTEPMMQIPSELPALPLRDIVIYPFMIVPLFVSRDKSIKAVEQALKENRMIVLVSQTDINTEDPTQSDLYQTGTVAIIMRMLKLPDGRIRIFYSAGKRFSRRERAHFGSGGSRQSRRLLPARRERGRRRSADARRSAREGPRARV